MDLTLVGVNGDRFAVHGAMAGSRDVALLKGSKNFWEAPLKAIWMQGAFQEGATYMGHKVEPIDAVLAFGVRGATRVEWEANDDAFRQALGDPDSVFRIEANSSSGLRELDLRLTGAPELVGDTSPESQNFSQYIVQARAGWPRWVGVPDTDVWVSSTGNDSGFVTVSNPTDTWMYPQWVCSAPGKWTLPDFSWNDDQWSSRVITTPTLTVGQDLTIDTYPATEPYVARDGSNIAGRFGGVLFLHPVPPHTPPTEIPVKLTSGSAGSACMLRMPRNYRRPRGGDRT